jgi:hypothetical protein
MQLINFAAFGAIFCNLGWSMYLMRITIVCQTKTKPIA